MSQTLLETEEAFTMKEYKYTDTHTHTHTHINKYLVSHYSQSEQLRGPHMYLYPEAAVRKCSIKKLFLKMSQYSYENIGVGVSF